MNNKTIQELKEQLRLAEEAERTVRLKAQEEFIPVYTYTVRPMEKSYEALMQDLGGIRINAVPTEETVKQAQELGIALERRSMCYVWVNGIIYRGGGGYILLTDPEQKDAFVQRIPASEEEWKSILRGVIPARLLKRDKAVYLPKQ